MHSPSTTELIDQLREVLPGRLSDIGRRFSRLISTTVPHSALVIFTRECTGRPRKVAGDPRIADRVTIAELEALRDSIAEPQVVCGPAVIAGQSRPVYAILDRTGTLLVVVPTILPLQPPHSLDTVRALFGVVATGIALQVNRASPAYLAESRAASAERNRTVDELTDQHAVVLQTLLSTLRSPDLDDARARVAARETASAALVALRTTAADHRSFVEESLGPAFGRLGDQLRALLAHLDVDLELVTPPARDRTLAGEVAHGARALVRGAVSAMLHRGGRRRIRVSWEVTDADLTVDVRDDRGDLDDCADLDRQLRPRIETLDGELTVEATPDWGSRVVARLPLAPPTAAAPVSPALIELGDRESEVIAHLVGGRSNRAIAELLGISESTVKFHVAGILRKLDVRTRAEAAVLARESGIRPPAVPSAGRDSPSD
ncbi:MAG: LuxR C-terminal-related transcriptional regulator [Gordonia sp. (in: high G+C Gram-positive bacteria)]|uniref:helix-turn-helix transcriptional regulator n=1 Tax=Gordonia sp. (in: high G+C Gram-positive bacteria) TaxID=84139 RepID=UPI003C7346B2